MLRLNGYVLQDVTDTSINLKEKRKQGKKQKQKEQGVTKNVAISINLCVPSTHANKHVCTHVHTRT